MFHDNLLWKRLDVNAMVPFYLFIYLLRNKKSEFPTNLYAFCQANTKCFLKFKLYPMNTSNFELHRYALTHFNKATHVPVES